MHISLRSMHMLDSASLRPINQFTGYCFANDMHFDATVHSALVPVVSCMFGQLIVTKWGTKEDNISTDNCREGTIPIINKCRYKTGFLSGTSGSITFNTMKVDGVLLFIGHYEVNSFRSAQGPADPSVIDWGNSHPHKRSLLHDRWTV